MEKSPLVSIIIPLHWGLKSENFGRFCDEFVHFLKLDYPHYELLVVADKKVKLPFSSPKLKLLVTNANHPTSPAEKRDFALKYAKGEISTFIDDDAYPDKNWLSRAVIWFRNPYVVGVGGPGITPPNDGYWEKIGGQIIESYLCSGGIQGRFYVDNQTPPAFVDDWPAYNLFIRTVSLKKVGGFQSTFYGGEDTYVCLRLNKLGVMVFEPQSLIYHHRRAFLMPHLKQIRNVGIHRGYFFKAYPETSRSLFYLMPTLLTLGFLLLSVGSIITPQIRLIFIFLNIVFISAGAFSVIKRTNLQDSLIISVGIILTHMTYGIYFIKGLLTSHLSH